MPHILLEDENGNPIGGSDEGHRTAEPDHEVIRVTLNVAEVIRLHNIRTKKEKDDD